ncbi:DUF4817 domain-containing protein [Trichonephila clavipes]|nr:DUF4817 domain-containing protein [Trichonephila clavipes]
MTHTSKERATETVLFAGMSARVPETYADVSPFLANQRASRKMVTSKQKAFCVLQFAKAESAITVQRVYRIKFGCQPPQMITFVDVIINLKLAFFVKGKQDGAPHHCHLSVRDWLNITVPNQWIIRKELPDKACATWPPRSLNLTACDFYLSRFIKDCVYIPPLPSDLSDLKHRMEADDGRISSDTLKKVWDEFVYRLDWRHVTNGTHIEHLLTCR